MATLYISEFPGDHLRYHMQAAQPPSLNDQLVTLTTTATSATAFGPNTHLARLCTDTACWVAFNTTATTSSLFLPANVPEYFVVSPGQTVSALT